MKWRWPKGTGARGIGGALLSIAVLAVVAATLLMAVGLVRIKLLENTQEMGMALAHSYGVEVEQNISMMGKYAQLASSYVDELLTDGEADQEIQEWLSGYFAKLTQMMGAGLVDPYAVINGRIVAANPWEGDATYSYEDALWYQQALAAQGELVYGEVYTDVITGQRVFTLSVALTNPGDVFAMDVYIQNSSLYGMATHLPQDSSYYLCDQEGGLIYASTGWDVNQEDLQGYAYDLMKRIMDGSLLASDATFQDPEGVNRGAYYYHLDNGWTAILTIPIHSILLGDQNVVILLLSGGAVVLFVALTLMTVRDAVRNRRMKRADDTVHMLGDSFYAIFRVNFRDGVYEGIKISNDLQEPLPRKGDYALVLRAIHFLVKPSTYQEFEQSFALESIRKRVELGVPDYGGDYQRRFGETYRWVNVRTLYDPEVAPNEVILCFRDVDEEKRRELEHTMVLQEALEEAQESTQAKSEFFNRMSHDMRTPLYSILGCCRLAQGSCRAGELEQTSSYLNKVQFAGNQLLALVNDILELSTAEAGKTTLQESPFDLRGLLEDVGGIFRDRAQEGGKTLEIRLDLPAAMVMGDAQKIGQILNNLLSNGIKYTNPGDKIWLKARYSTASGRGSCEIVVEDTGIGMTEEFLRHLFEPYTRETTFSSRSTVGTGLGMAIAKHMVHQMGGEISVESKLGQGSRFTVILPLSIAECSLDREEPGEDEADWSGLRVLVAEDNDLNREMLTELLEQLGAEVLPAVNGADAVEVFSQSSSFGIDVILMDMQMPVMDGCQAARAIRALDRPDAQTVPILAVTANAYAEDMDKIARAGMNGHVSKPIDLEALGRTVKKLVSQEGKLCGV